MRLDTQEKKALQHALCDIDGDAFIFGSRTDEQARGGDVDLLVLTDLDAFHVSRRVAVRFNMECEEKIDVVAMPRHDRSKEQEAFLRTLNLERIK